MSASIRNASMSWAQGVGRSNRPAPTNASSQHRKYERAQVKSGAGVTAEQASISGRTTVHCRRPAGGLRRADLTRAHAEGFAKKKGVRNFAAAVFSASV
jgi:hypothetical protein